MSGFTGTHPLCWFYSHMVCQRRSLHLSIRPANPGFVTLCDSPSIPLLVLLFAVFPWAFILLFHKSALTPQTSSSQLSLLSSPSSALLRWLFPCAGLCSDLCDFSAAPSVSQSLTSCSFHTSNSSDKRCSSFFSSHIAKHVLALLRLTVPPKTSITVLNTGYVCVCLWEAWIRVWISTSPRELSLYASPLCLHAINLSDDLALGESTFKAPSLLLVFPTSLFSSRRKARTFP